MKYLIENPVSGLFLRHEGCNHFWGMKSDAMLYTSRATAMALAFKYQGVVKELC